MGGKNRSMRCAVAAALAMVVALAGSMALAEVSGAVASVVQADRVTPRISEEGHVRAVPIAEGEWAYMGEFVLDSGVEMAPDEPTHTEEYLYILSGSAVLNVDDKSFLVGPRMGIYLPAGTQIRWNIGSDPLVAVQVFAGPSIGPGYEDWTIQDSDEVWPRPRIYPRPRPTGVSAR